jgi:AraC-like DNA-binding protein
MSISTTDTGAAGDSSATGNSTEGIVSGWVIQLALITLENHGFCADQVLNDLEIAPDQLHHAHLSIDKETFQSLLAYGSNQMNISVPEFGYLCGQQCELNSFGPIGIAAMSAATFGETVDIAARFFPLTCPLFHIEKIFIDERVELVVSDDDMFNGDAREAIYWWMMGAMFTFISALLKPQIASVLPYVRFKIPADHRSKVIERFKQEIPWVHELMDYNAPHLSLGGPSSILDLPIKMANKFTVEQLVADSENLLLQCRTSLSQRIRDIINASEYHAPSLEEISQLVYMSPRSIHRALEKEGTSFRELSQHVRTCRAKDLLLQSNKTITEISDFLGFSSSSSFCTAFKRLCGVTPREFIKQARTE